MSSSISRIFKLSVFVLFIFSPVVSGQFANSAFSDAAVAYVAATGNELNFARGNPAGVFSPANSRLTLAFETNLNHFDSPTQSFALSFQINPVLRLSVGRWYPTATTGMDASGPGWYNRNVLSGLSFTYRQDWCAGLGYQMRPNLFWGLSVRQEFYSATSNFVSGWEEESEFLAGDLGGYFRLRYFSFGLVLRNLLNHQLDAGSSTLPNGVSGAWYASTFSGVHFQPERTLEAGIGWQPISRAQVLVDVTSLGEYALGMITQPFDWLSVRGGIGQRYDRIDAENAVDYGAVGMQCRIRSITLGASFIAPFDAGRQQRVKTPEMQYIVEQATNHQILVGIGFTH